MKYTKHLVLLIASFCFIHTSLFSQDVDIQKLQLAYKLISTFYVDTVNNQKLVEDAIVGMLDELDPHSSYLSKDEVSKLNEPLDGGFEGIGIQFNIFKDTLMVVSPISGGPSEKVGIIAGDRIVEIDGDNVAGVGLQNSDVFKYLKGKKGTEVKLKIKRYNVPELINFTVVRDKIPIFSVEAVYMATKDVGYIKINQFSATTHKEVMDALTKLKDEGMKKLILDLRGNPGGYLKAAINVSDELLDAKKLIVYTHGLTSPRQEYNSSAKGLFETGKVAVLIDEGSASASEIVTGAMQDWDRGVVIGRRSFGKGLVQRPFNLPDGSMMRLTIAQYYTPSGRCIQKPYEIGDKLHYEMEVYDRLRHGEGYSADSIHFDKSEKYYTNNKRLVYGGGGIMPDVFVPIDTTGYSDYYRDLISKGILNRFILSYVDNNRKSLEQEYKSFEKYKKQFVVDETMISALVKEGEKEGIVKDEEGLRVSEQEMKVQMKALIARNLWNSTEYFEIMNPTTEPFQKAIEILSDDAIYKDLLH